MTFRSFAVIPAAGQSTRMRTDKLWLPWGTVTVIETVLSAWQTSHVDEVLVVARADQQRLAELCRERGVTLVIPTIPPPQMKDSVSAALEHVRRSFAPAASDVWLLAPADLPRLAPTIIDQLLASHDTASPRILVPHAGGKRGHPVLFPWSLASEVVGLRDEEGVNVLLQRHEVREIACDDRHIHDDLDTPEDYQRLRRDDGSRSN